NCRSLVTMSSEEAVAPCLQLTFLVRASSTLASTRTVTRLSNVPCKVNASVGMTTDVTCPISTRSGASESATTWTPPPAENSRRGEGGYLAWRQGSAGPVCTFCILTIGDG